jgi:uncharacterized protein
VRREVMWSTWDGPGLEHLRLGMHDDSIVADGMVIGVTAGRPFRVAYEVRCEVGWRVRAVRVGVQGPEQPEVDLLSDGEGNWTTADGRAVSEMHGCLDVDISVTPFTNSLPIRRLDLEPTEFAEISVAYITGLVPWVLRAIARANSAKTETLLPVPGSGRAVDTRRP